MKTLFSFLFLMAFLEGRSQIEKADNIFIVTTDGFRWQEVFSGADSLLINDPSYVSDTALTKQMYWHPSPAERRKKLLPFFWTVLSKEGLLYGNRLKESKVDVRNLYKISYPGYNELLTGYADPLSIRNSPKYNRNISVLEYLNMLPEYKGKVAAFTSWNIFPYILNDRRSSIKQNNGYQLLDDTLESTHVYNNVLEALEFKNKTRYDVLTFFAAKEHIKNHHPKVVFISLGETDEFAHEGKYDLYLQQATAVDKMISELWYLVQTDPIYKNKTAFIISTDHGRGKYNDKWKKHNTFIRGSGEIWLALIGKGIPPMGEMQNVDPIYQNQVAATAGQLLGKTMRTNRKIGEAITMHSLEKWIAIHSNRTIFLSAIRNASLVK